MEGLGIDDMYNEENELDTEDEIEDTEDTIEDTEEGIEEIPKDRTEKRKVGKLPLIVMFVIGLIIGIIISPYILEMFDEEETPIYKQYTIRGEDTIVFKNEKLKVQITIDPDINQTCEIEATWIDIETNETRKVHGMGTYGGHQWFLDYILDYGEYILTANQKRWFRYMLLNVIK